MSYAEVTERIWSRSGDAPSDEQAQMREIVRCATLAPSGHNTQPWHFRISGRVVEILPDSSRRTPVVDPDDHHLFVSLGCALENLVQAARAFGFEPRGEPTPGESGGTAMTLERCRAERSILFDAIPDRQCTRSEFDGRPLDASDLRRLEAAATGRGVAVLLLTERDAMERVLEYVIQANTRQLENPAFVDELESWIRFSDREAIRTRDGLSARSSGNPPVPRWVGRVLFRALLRAKPENDKYALQVRSSAGIAVFSSAADDRGHWVEAGRCYERFALQATAMGVRNAFVNQPVEEASLRPALAAALGLGGRRLDLLVRFGRGRAMPRSLRRPLEEVLM